MKNYKDLIIGDIKRISKSQNVIAIKRYLITNASFKMTFWFRIGSVIKKCKNRGKFFIINISYGIVFLIHKHNQYY
jgi:serine O-acetyltransferase